MAQAGRQPAAAKTAVPPGGKSQNAQLVTAPPRALSLQDALRKARMAQAAGRPDADKIYKQMSEQFPDSPDLPGELGNIYYVQGKLNEAAEQYFETAKRLMRRNQPAQAACLIPVLKRLDPQKAAFLARQTSPQSCPAQRR